MGRNGFRPIFFFRQETLRMIRTVVSDLGNVLLRFDHMRACQAMARMSPWSPQEVYDSMFGSNLVRDYELGRISSSEFAQGCAARLDLDVGVDATRHIWSDIFHPVEGMEGLIRSLKEHYTLVLLSNTNEWHFEHCREKYPVVRLFDHHALSYRLGCRKPNPLIYEKALAMANALPEETLYFDDIPAYVEAARELGWKGICFQDRDQVTREMKAEGMSCP
jgi:HAD superfamily hydrolase (TIGR01509 family)